jgi:DNA-binding LacI/PurR family transcriptional regulator
MVDLGDMKDHNDIDRFTQIGYESTKQAFEKDPNIDACFYLSDYFAMGGVKYLVESGRKVGSDVLVAGFNNTYAIRSFPFPISSIAHDTSAIAVALIDGMDGNGPLTKKIPTRTFIRK